MAVTMVETMVRSSVDQMAGMMAETMAVKMGEHWAASRVGLTADQTAD
jgi:hypothetical protein